VCDEGHTSFYCPPGVAAILRDWDDEGRTIKLIHVDHSSPADVAGLIRSAVDDFSDGDPFPAEFVQSHRDRKPLVALHYEDGGQYSFHLDVDDSVLSAL